MARTHTYRRTLAHRVAIQAPLVPMSILAVIFGWVGFFHENTDGEGRLWVIAMVAFSLGCSAGLWQAARQELIVDGRGITIRGGLRRRHWSWDQIAEVDAGAFSAFGVAPFVRLTNGARVWLYPAGGWAFLFGRGPERSAKAVESIRISMREHCARDLDEIE